MYFLDPLFYCIVRNDENNKKNSLWEVILLSFFKMSPELYSDKSFIFSARLTHHQLTRLGVNMDKPWS